MDMKITEFKKHDLITRVEPNLLGDRSFMSEKMVFVGCEKGSIVVINEESFGTIVLPEDGWSNGWNYYPQNLVDEAEKLTNKGD